MIKMELLPSASKEWRENDVLFSVNQVLYLFFVLLYSFLFLFIYLYTLALNFLDVLCGSGSRPCVYCFIITAIIIIVILSIIIIAITIVLITIISASGKTVYFLPFFFSIWKHWPIRQEYIFTLYQVDLRLSFPLVFCCCFLCCFCCCCCYVLDLDPQMQSLFHHASGAARKVARPAATLFPRDRQAHAPLGQDALLDLWLA